MFPVSRTFPDNNFVLAVPRTVDLTKACRVQQDSFDLDPVTKFYSYELVLHFVKILATLLLVVFSISNRIWYRQTENQSQ